jgi:copper chaperone CopZ
MKKFLVVLLAIGLIHPATAQAETIKATVNGMVCAFCAQGLERVFGKLDAVEKITADLDNMLVTIVLKKGKQLDYATVRASVTANGLDTVKIERTLP